MIAKRWRVGSFGRRLIDSLAPTACSSAATATTIAAPHAVYPPRRRTLLAKLAEVDRDSEGGFQGLLATTRPHEDFVDRSTPTYYGLGSVA